MTEDTLYNTYIIPFDANKGFPQTHRISVYKWIFDITWSYNIISKMPILTVKNSSGKIFGVNQIVSCFAYYLQDDVTGEPIMTIITKDVSLTKIKAYLAINRNWSGVKT